MAWGDDLDDSDDEQPQQQHHVHSRVGGGGGGSSHGVGKSSGGGSSSAAGGGGGGSGSSGTVGTGGLVIPPTHRSRIDTKGIQIVTSYRQNNIGQLIKTVTKVKVSTEQIREPIAVKYRRTQWKKFGQAAADAETSTTTTVQSKEEIHMEDPNADTDLQDEDPAAAIAGNLNAFWAKQKRRQLERIYDVNTESGAGDPNAPGAGGGSGGPDADGGSGSGGGGGWTQVGAGGASANPGGSSGGKYIPPGARAAAAAGGAAGPGGSTSLAAGYKPERRMDDLNTIRVTNLSGNTTESDLQDLFQTYGRISRVYLAKDKETLQSRGFAFVSFVNKDDAARAMEELQGYGYDHLILKLEWARPNAKDPSAATEFRSGYGKALAQDTKEKVSFASNLTK